MTRRQLQRARGRAECARFFEGIRGELSAYQIRALPRMKALSTRSGYATRSGRGHRASHKQQSRAMRRFKARVAFYSRGPELGFTEQLRAFVARPQWDAVLCRPTGAYEFFDERTCTTTVGAQRLVAPFGYIEWRIGAETWFLPVTRSQRALAIAILQTRRDARRSRTITPATLAARHPSETA